MSTARRRKRAEKKFRDRCVPKEARIANRRVVREMLADGRLAWTEAAPAGTPWLFLNFDYVQPFPSPNP